MILISAGLVLAAVVLLIAGFVLAKPFLIMWSIVVSVLSALFLVIGAFLRRHELFPGGGQAAAPATPPAGLLPPGLPYNQTGPVAHQPPPQQPRPQPPQRTVTVPATAPRRPPAGGLAPDAIVLVIPGRKRYHVAGCRQLAGREHEELTHEEAREEGFTPCTTCLPDAALGGRQLPPAADPEPAAAPPSAFAAESRAQTAAESRAQTAAESRAETAGETRDLRPPVAPPKPDTKASTPSPEPAAAHEEGAAGWFGRPAAASAGQAHSSAAASESEDEQAETQTSIFRPPPNALRSESPSSGPTSRPSSGEPSQASGTSPASGSAPSKPGAGPSRPAGDARTPADKSDTSSAGKTGTPAAKGGPSTGKGDTPADETGPAADGPGPGAGKAAAPEGVTEPSLRRPGQPAPSTGKPDAPGGGPGETVANLRQPGRPVWSQSPAEDDDSGPSTAPQPRVPSSAAPARPGGPGAPGGSAGSSQRPSGGLSGAAKMFGPAQPEEEVVLERPASSAESEAKPQGPLPPGSTAFARSSKERPSGTGASSAGAKADPPRTGAPAKSQTSGAKTEAAGSKGGDEPAAASKDERSGTVKVIVGTRRYHSTACPLIKGAGESGVETMTLAAAEAAGLTSCSVCQHDRETVA
ncbi:hypothetical protein [Nonomuraea sp. 10N515B]|uniref:hypothetical protein n=1 Tax=Nonomuraea sp. 10N515B TaxID=3457422 RepID=UPI003FCD183A